MRSQPGAAPDGIDVGSLTDEELTGLAEQLSALESPIGMARSCVGGAFAIRAHTEVISAAFVDLMLGKYDRMILTTPPQVGKSWVAGIWAPFWWLCNRPADRLAVVSYGLTLAASRGKAVRRLVNEYGARFGIRLAPDSRAVNDWHLERTDGGLRCVGIGGGLTGQPVDGVLIIDDPHKDRAEADSRTKREAVHAWYSSTGQSRLAPHTPVVIVQTRWHDDDLAGRRIKEEGLIEEGGRWKLLHMPALAGPRDYLGRRPGEPLEHPKIARGDRREALAHWREKRRSTNARDWGALYMGDPRPAEGALLSRDIVNARIHHGPMPQRHRVGVAVDPSGGGRDVAGIVGGFTDPLGVLYWTHDRSGVMPSEDWSREACMLVVDIGADRIIVEKNFGADQASTLIKFAWKHLREEWQEAHPDPGPGEVNPYGLMMPMIIMANSRRGKYLRADPVAGFVAQDKIRFGPGLSELVDEWCTWQPDSPESPGRIDASVHLAYDLVKALPAGNVASSPASVPKTGRGGGQGAAGAAPMPGGGVAGARIPRAGRPRPGAGPSGLG